MVDARLHGCSLGVGVAEAAEVVVVFGVVSVSRSTEVSRSGGGGSMSSWPEASWAAVSSGSGALGSLGVLPRRRRSGMMAAGHHTDNGPSRVCKATPGGAGVRV